MSCRHWAHVAAVAHHTLTEYTSSSFERRHCPPLKALRPATPVCKVATGSGMQAYERTSLASYAGLGRAPAIQLLRRFGGDTEAVLAHVYP